MGKDAHDPQKDPLDSIPKHCRTQKKAHRESVFYGDSSAENPCNASEFLQCILSDVALNASRANTFYASFKDISNTIDNQRISISGVDEDEEAVNLVKYQNGYNLASKMIQTLTEIYDRLILETGVYPAPD